MYEKGNIITVNLMMTGYGSYLHFSFFDMDFVCTCVTKPKMDINLVCVYVYVCVCIYVVDILTVSFIISIKELIYLTL